MPEIDLSHKTQQLALDVQLNDEASFDDFCWSGNEFLREQLLPVLSHKSERIFYIWGEPGCGKSHLLQAYCHAMSQNEQSARYVPLKLLHEWDPAILEGMADDRFVAIDDIDVIAGDEAWEEALFHLYNRVYDSQSMLIITGQTPPAGMSIQLADLRSRLSCALVVHLKELSDEHKIATLQLRAHKRGLELSVGVGQYIVNHCARNMHHLLTILDTLDHASLVAQRKLTIPFVKEILL